MEGGGHWNGEYISLDDCLAGPILTEDVAEVVHHYMNGDRWDGKEIAILKLTDGRYVGWETWYGPTGSGFFADAYGGDVDIYFAKDYHTYGYGGFCSRGVFIPARRGL